MSPFQVRKGRVIWFRNKRSSHPPESYHRHRLVSGILCGLRVVGSWGTWEPIRKEHMGLISLSPQGLSRSCWPCKQHLLCWSQHFMWEMWPYSALWRTLIGLISGGSVFQSCVLRWRFNLIVTTCGTICIIARKYLFSVCNVKNSKHCQPLTVAVWGQRMGLSPLYSAGHNNKAHPDRSPLQLWL